MSSYEEQNVVIEIMSSENKRILFKNYTKILFICGSFLMSHLCHNMNNKSIPRL